MTDSATIVRPPGVAGSTRPATGRRLLWLGVALAALTLACLASIAFGARVVGWGEIVTALSGDGVGIAEAAVVKRIPRTVLGLLVGAALGLSGALMQGVTRNPLADPGILGVTNGAALAVVAGIAFCSLTSPAAFVWVAILGAAVAAVLVYAIGSLGRGGATPLKLALAGAASAAAFSSLVSAILLPRAEVMNSFRFWQIGGVGGGSYTSIALVAPFLIAGAVIGLGSARGLNALALGDDVAAGFGERVAVTRLVAAAGGVLLCGAATAVAGPIAFVGLVVPHVCRLVIGLDHRWLLPFCALAGAGLLVVSDVIGRVVARPAEVDVGIITALVGAPVFIWIVRRQKVREL